MRNLDLYKLFNDTRMIFHHLYQWLTFKQNTRSFRRLPSVLGRWSHPISTTSISAAVKGNHPYLFTYTEPRSTICCSQLRDDLSKRYGVFQQSNETNKILGKLTRITTQLFRNLRARDCVNSYISSLEPKGQKPKTRRSVTTPTSKKIVHSTGKSQTEISSKLNYPFQCPQNGRIKQMLSITEIRWE